MKMGQSRPPLPPFTEETAKTKVKAAEDAWNTRDPERVAGAYTEDSGHWHRAYGNELWEFADNGLMRRREASINDVRISADERRFASPTWATDDLPLR
jgi:nuclear transport factor 2 (NTF2) superfamily protein